MLTLKERKLLSFLVVSTIVMVLYTTYISVNNHYQDSSIVNDKIYILHVSGEVEPDFMYIYEQQKNKLAHIVVNTYEPKLTSSNVVPNDWNLIAQDIGNVYSQYDAFIIVHGKDTLSYTASALSFMLENLDKPVILTDGNLAHSLYLASYTNIPEVMVLAEKKLIRGCRTINTNDGFNSPNYPYLTEENCLRPSVNNTPSIRFVNPNNRVIVVKLYPGINAKYFKSLIKQGFIHGIVLETYGDGTNPTNELFLKMINALARKGVIIVSVSQTNSRYSKTDIRLIEAGVLPGGDMTTQSAFAKLHYLLGNVEDNKLMAGLLEQSFRGEMTI